MGVSGNIAPSPMDTSCVGHGGGTLQGGGCIASTVGTLDMEDAIKSGESTCCHDAHAECVTSLPDSATL
eukprot:4557192-Amphidinium_carterae.3